ncbi:hypothetical protein JTE90_014434 [Oedothorax gibbosus]|uniref:Uncharacterized protein n=1 Tax=Oedothorax gibbosus TaxID=931172 RepID=A0AAV6V2J2_9ARAC|nr:hypothetical protein JTE90_014434 [Oedothorax gibbosus]
MVRKFHPLGIAPSAHCITEPLVIKLTPPPTRGQVIAHARAHRGNMGTHGPVMGANSLLVPGPRREVVTLKSWVAHGPS